MKLLYTREALADLVRLREFIAKDNPKTAGPVSATLVQGIARLRDFPLLGKEVPQAPDPEVVRDLILNKYVVRYLVLSSSIYILRVWHQREDRLKPYAS